LRQIKRDIPARVKSVPPARLDMLPFTPAQFQSVFAAYNDAIWPAQIVAYMLGGVA